MFKANFFLNISLTIFTVVGLSQPVYGQRDDECVYSNDFYTSGRDWLNTMDSTAHFIWNEEEGNFTTSVGLGQTVIFKRGGCNYFSTSLVYICDTWLGLEDEVKWREKALLLAEWFKFDLFESALRKAKYQKVDTSNSSFHYDINGDGILISNGISFSKKDKSVIIELSYFQN